ncbi:carboxypeptidase-like regulatory domain-containing protein [Flavobacterium suncheonense]|uniref:Carboxypeptidase-like regulatory domain-containing protein n=1 Tax=Flavobacterium suncheonense GH29-5 = DSM 17707 TaxID=1121899 RepID=A0A0A2M3A3_9FLAO|nr:carboxypeptidase-like regulatory domain-containing protein [Flavobacterium suncheonense]KGO85953.1 hypothetical protein Q764_13875 [Flavobacterium suncheonense GH29-5 = DSM 17707]
MDSKKFLLVIFILSFFLSTYGQKIVNGKIIDENIEFLAGARVYTNDTIELGKTDFNGNFKINLPEGNNKITFRGLGYDSAIIDISKNCDYLEVILLQDGTYDFMSAKKIDRLRKRRFEKLSELHLIAFQKGLFKEKKPCFNQEFVPIKPELDRIAIDIKAIKENNKKSFKKLAVGDTIKIPFSGTYRYDGTNRTTLFAYSSLTDEDTFDCVIEGVITEKSKNRKGYNLVYKVTNINNCKYDSIVYDNKQLIIGETFTHNMKYFKVIIK